VIAVVGVFALGIGAASASFSMVYGVLLQPLPYGHGRHVALLRQFNAANPDDDAGFSPLEIANYRARTHVLASIAEYHSMWFNVVGGPEPERLQVGVVSPEFFDVLGVRPTSGRLFTADDDRAESEPVLLLSEPYWRRAFAGDPAVVGRTLTLNDKVHRVVGILPALPAYPDANDVYMPTLACPFRQRAVASNDWHARTSQLFAELKPGATMADARADVAAVGAAMAAAHPDAYAGEAGFGSTLAPLDTGLGAPSRPLLLLFGIVVAVLAILCANVGSLTLARVLKRGPEIDMRARLGASRGRLARQFITESLLLSCAGGALGLLGLASCLSFVRSAAERFSPRAAEIGMHPAVIWFAIGAAGVAGLVSGIAPGFAIGRQQGAPVVRRADGTRRRRRTLRLREGLVFAQVLMTIVLLLTAGVMLRSLARLENVDPGFDLRNVLTMRISVDWSRFEPVNLRHDLLNQYVEAAARVPGVTAAALSGTLPLESTHNRARIGTRGLPDVAPAEVRIVTPDYFRVMDVPIVAGRLFSAAGNESVPEAVVSEKMARRLWGTVNALGQQFNADDKTFSVIGIVGDTRQRIDADAIEEFYLPLDHSWPPRESQLVVRTTGDPHVMATPVARAIHGVEPNQPVAGIRTLDELRGVSLAPWQLMTWLLGACGAAALVIALTGVAGLLAFMVSQRSHEFGIRLALGASPWRLVALIVRQGLVPVAGGLASGLIIAWLVIPLVTPELYATSPTDPLVFFLGATLLALTSFIACAIPARRAAMADPLRALREA
jgi:predicted permease